MKFQTELSASTKAQELVELKTAKEVKTAALEAAVVQADEIAAREMHLKHMGAEQALQVQALQVEDDDRELERLLDELRMEKLVVQNQMASGSFASPYAGVDDERLVPPAAWKDSDATSPLSAGSLSAKKVRFGQEEEEERQVLYDQAEEFLQQPRQEYHQQSYQQYQPVGNQIVEEADGDFSLRKSLRQLDQEQRGEARAGASSGGTPTKGKGVKDIQIGSGSSGSSDSASKAASLPSQSHQSRQSPSTSRSSPATSRGSPSNHQQYDEHTGRRITSHGSPSSSSKLRSPMSLDSWDDPQRWPWRKQRTRAFLQVQ
jgi:hypothetical protein